MSPRQPLSTLTLIAWVAGLSVGCGRPPPTQAEVADAKGRVEGAVEAASHAREALELLGVVPVYTCGEPRRTFVGQAAQKVRAEHGCVAVSTEARSDAEDALLLTYQAEDCRIFGKRVTGSSLFRYSGGEDRLTLEADFRLTSVNGTPVQATAGYGTCSDERRYWGLAEGQLRQPPGVAFRVDGKVAVREGLPVIGGTTLIVDGAGELSQLEGIDRITFAGLEYELTEYLPREGSVVIETASGHRVEARFRPSLWRLGEAEVTLDEQPPVTVPIVH